MERDAMVKINDRHEFPLDIDLSEFLDETADKTADWNYKLHGVLVHSGDLHGGHYYALLKPEKDGKWFRFDDDRVTPCTLKEVLDENFGGVVAPSVRLPNRPLQGKRFMNAYMLVYIRESKLDEILGPVSDSDIPKHVSARIEEELAEEARRKKEREEMHLYLYVRTVKLEDFKNHDAFDICDMNSAELEQAKVYKTLTYGEYKAQVAKEHNVSVEQVRHWVMVNRQNKTIRPDAVLGPQYDDKTLAEVHDEVAGRRQEILLYLEILDAKDVDADLADGVPENTLFMLFVKYFDVDTQKLFGLTTLHLHKNDKIEVAIEKISSLAGRESLNLRLFEEIKPGMIESLRPKVSFAQAEIVDGDIITMQRAVDETERLALHKQGKFSVATEYYDFCHNKLTVVIMPRSAEQQVTDKFELTMSKKSSYDQVVAKIGEQLKVDPTHIRLSAVGAGNQPRQHFKPNGNMTLNNMLQPGYLQTPVMALAYEVLETSLKEFENKRLLKVTFLPEGLTKESPVEFLVPKASTVEDAVNMLAAKLQLPSEQAQALRLYETHSNRYQKHSDPTASVQTLQEYSTLYAELVTEDDVKQNETDRQIQVVHFQKEPTRSHGIPFTFWLRKGEIWRDARVRLHRKTRYKDDDFKKIKGAIISPSSPYSKPTYLEDDDQPWDLCKLQDDALGLDHLDKTVKPSRFGERAIKISG
jgi:ubiquitin carboxyl-terminal hydrolase 7